MQLLCSHNMIATWIRDVYDCLSLVSDSVCMRRVQAKLVEEGARSHAQSTEEYYHAERDYTRAQHTVEEIEVRYIISNRRHVPVRARDAHAARLPYPTAVWTPLLAIS